MLRVVCERALWNPTKAYYPGDGRQHGAKVMSHGGSGVRLV